MVNDPMDAGIMKLVDILLSVPDEISLHEINNDIEYDLGVKDEHEIKRLTLMAIREMFRRGAQVDFYSGSPSGIDHPDNKEPPDQIIARIDREWEANGKPPSFHGDICVFVWTPEAMEAYMRKKAAAI
jgi:hypothetical protein